ncbi:MAG TPA: carbohydrate ABC transporter permease [Candidatus Gemmiger excrementigallinarum]|mgnify:FL=1|uniref:Carbohydrate ABC transporter permease n=1 Tax=Candidatus Gemmiger excrementigallinarum TaxID=2838609 RepID=A0A9D2ERW5_9FIRM|nr:carbohydrate ABC transporter permease [Candidatus Gemmiger excrementigallinarum]
MKNTKDTRAVPSYNGLRVKEQLRLLPGHLIVGLWCLFTLGMLLWIVAASLSTSPEIMRGEVLKFATGLHPENYVKAWTANNISVFFLNSLLYSTCTMIGSLLISAPAAYVLGRFVFRGNKVVRSGFITAMSLPHIMIVMPLFSMATRANLTGSKIVLIFIYIGMQVPYTTTFLISFFSSLSRVYEEAAAIDGCPPMKTFWKIMLPLAQPGLVTVGIFNFMNIWNEYFLSLIFASSERNMSVGPGLKSVLTAMQYTGDWGGLFAAVVIVFLPTLILFLCLSKTIISGITAGGVKG